MHRTSVQCQIFLLKGKILIVYWPSVNSKTLKSQLKELQYLNRLFKALYVTVLMYLRYNDVS